VEEWHVRRTLVLLKSHIGVKRGREEKCAMPSQYLGKRDLMRCHYTSNAINAILQDDQQRDAFHSVYTWCFATAIQEAVAMNWRETREMHHQWTH
jgi:hypothetical protein